MQPTSFEQLRADRFVENCTSSLSAEWNVSDGQVKEKSVNYRRYLAETSIKISYSEILSDIYNLYIKHDIQRAMNNNSCQFERINQLCIQALNTNNVTHLIRAYTLDGSFFRILNHHLAIVVSANDVEKMNMTKAVKMHYWEGPLDIAMIFVYHPSLEHFRFKQGIVYRGLYLEKEEDLRMYQTIGNRLLNKTFISTSKRRDVAMAFISADFQSSTSRRKRCLLTYTLVDSAQRTALDIQTLSQFPDEEEVLILPYANFQVTNYRPSPTDPDLIEIELRECPSE